jgi:hypothetical protein
MIADEQADVIFISDRLPDRHPALVDGLGRILEDHGVCLGQPAAGGLPAVLDLPVRAVGAAVPAGVDRGGRPASVSSPNQKNIHIRRFCS